MTATKYHLSNWQPIVCIKLSAAQLCLTTGKTICLGRELVNLSSVWYICTLPSDLESHDLLAIQAQKVDQVTESSATTGLLNQ